MRQSFDLVDVILTRKQCLRIQYYANNHDVFLYFLTSILMPNTNGVKPSHHWCGG